MPSQRFKCSLDVEFRKVRLAAFIRGRRAEVRVHLLRRAEVPAMSSVPACAKPTERACLYLD